MSGFIPRHIEQPAPRQSKPAFVNRRSRPSRSAWAFTCWEPGTTIAYTPSATLRPSITSAAARRSPIREFVHEPMNTRSSSISFDWNARLEAHVLERAFVLLGQRLGARPRDGHDHSRVRSPRHHRAECLGGRTTIFVGR